MAYRGPSIQTHLEWLGLVQPVGLVVAPVVLDDKELYPESQVTTLADGQRRLADLLEERELESGHKAVSVGSFERFATEILEWSNSDIKPATEHPTPIEVVLEEYGEVLKPSHVVAGAGPDNKHDVLVQELAAGTAMDELLKGDGHGWEASPHHRFERLLKESEHPIGLLFNGEALRLIFAPRGESSGYITFPLEPMTTVAGRPMLGALQMLLGVDRMFSGSSDQRLPELLNESRKRQNDVSTRLAEQVLEALWELLLGFDEAERNAQNKGTTVLGDLAKQDPDHIYGGLITVLLRLVFLLYAEDEDLMPPDSLYGQHYSVSGLAIRLRQEADEHKGGMASRRGAWASLLSLFRLVYDGGGATEAYLPARHGELFDPDAYPFLEGRSEELGYEAGILENLPAISDDVVEKVLSKLLWLDGERLSYRALDVEQIGSVYEGIMGFRVEQAQATSVGITHRPPRQKITISVVVNAEELLEQPASKREKWLDDQAGVKLKLPAAIKKELKSAFNVEEVLEALGKRLSPHTPRGLNPGSLVLQPTAERRRSGSHYTPRSLTEPIVKEAFRPWLERNDHKPTAEAILDLKVCDPAMGSGAFLVATCRYLAGLLVEAWERDGFPTDFEEAWDKDIYARRLVAQRCLYGVDKNPFAVNLARLSLWLVTLSKELPFTFVDHALKCGNSLTSVKQLDAIQFLESKQLNIFQSEKIARISEATHERNNSFLQDTLCDSEDTSKRNALKRSDNLLSEARQAADLILYSQIKENSLKPAKSITSALRSVLADSEWEEEARQELAEIRKAIATSISASNAFHWEIEFPEIFGRENPGFDAVIQNPPFLGGRKISTMNSIELFNLLTRNFQPAKDTCDLCSYFIRLAYNITRSEGTVSSIGTQTISKGESREGGLAAIKDKGGQIYSAKTSFKWPGTANVIISTVHISKGKTNCETILNNRPAKEISAFLLPSGPDHSPPSLRKSGNKVSLGSVIYGSGFIIDDNDTEANPSCAISHLTNEKELSRIKPYIGGEEFNQTPDHNPSRQVIYLSDIQTENELKEAPELEAIIREKVRPLRMSLGNNPVNKPLKNRWWAYQAHRPGFYSECEKLDKIIAGSKTSTLTTFDFINTGYIYSDKLVLFASESIELLTVLQSQLHNIWIETFCPPQGQGIAYSISDGFESFPLPKKLEKNKSIREAGSAALNLRKLLMQRMDIGLTEIHKLLNNPFTKEEQIQELREAFNQADRAMLRAYNINEEFNNGFSLVNFEAPEDSEIPESLAEKLTSPEFFCSSAEEAMSIESQFKAHTKRSSKLQWRYRWRLEERQHALSELLAANELEVNKNLSGDNFQ